MYAFGQLPNATGVAPGATSQPTQNTTKFSYNAGAGLRLDVGRGVFRALVSSQSVDFGGSYGSSSVTQYRIDFGTKL